MNKKMPVLFIGHGSPMNAVLNNEYTEAISKSTQNIPRPEAILVISAHWETEGTFITSSDEPEQIYDFYGFPDELYNLKYNPTGSRKYAQIVAEELKNSHVMLTEKWGLDHGAWAVLSHMYPKADIPVFEMSLNKLGDEQYHYDLGRKLSKLREKGILIIGSGDIVHNLGIMDYDMNATPFEWASEFDNYICDAIVNRKHDNIINYQKIGKSAKLSVPTKEHYLPLLYIAGIQDEEDEVNFIYKGIQHSSMSMTSIKIG
ncbi:4,5-DOPA dioxygenase extradiol [Clostridium estertheticum]|uniref:4,5-DOPA-extradiol-dioxygenase n=1 Tax=Clostridium estertheticum TaxID=238834 RepID=UPI001C7E1A41|nr:4,5-DOPA dioxygenase extradiol [Clostridium estertheticum]MBX4264263.1 4,5-DOPA dioxygenase extradiol [Clostridium estertheticum]WLC89114.1 4,5-DOPA dioxygenase extradiol [Clostridium estertheticum]